jgi:hypothetical protein
LTRDGLVDNGLIDPAKKNRQSRSVNLGHGNFLITTGFSGFSQGLSGASAIIP